MAKDVVREARHARLELSGSYVAVETEALRLVSEAFASVGDEAISAIVTPAVERLMRGDVQIVDLEASEGKGKVQVLRTKGLAHSLRKAGLEDELVAVGVRYARCFERARIGGLTASYDGVSVKGMVGQPERWLDAIDVLRQANAYLDSDMIRAVNGYVVLDLSCADVGGIVSIGVTSDRNMRIFAGKLYLRKALIRLQLFFEDMDWRAENQPMRPLAGL
ncbi:hypothetical protein Q1W73_16540 [Asticcacaulis sp. ZE23SCel15]|uniref:hypothetical protein n=1 Tax=Asticcacaulis sp. ZE23SCel15 TaxID=3059027 RepID=UPI00265E4D04|nr:hypothetical protein [Asticcacaulis sp. ZE23SCel15]WKL57252.1 hypothetical protein Q1W73_16540 [Asticcacaulis sp. ZE23SCel15]